MSLEPFHPNVDPTLVKENVCIAGRFKKHQFSDGIKQKIKLLHCTDNFHGILYCLEDWSIILVCFGISSAANRHCTLLVSIFFYITAVCIIGTRIRGLTTLLHESSHGTLASNRMLNMLLGTVFSGWAVFQSWTGYHRTHVVEHHNLLGDAERDPDFKSLIEAGLYDKYVKRSDIIQYILSIPMPNTMVVYMRYLIINRINPTDEYTIEKLMRFLFYILYVFTFWYTNLLVAFLIYWIVPMLTTAVWVGSFLEFFEHYPLLMRSPPINIFKSRNRICSTMEDFFLGIHNEGYHLVHHIWPRLPAWNLEKAHEIMLEDPTYLRIHSKKKGWPSIVKEVISYFDE